MPIGFVGVEEARGGIARALLIRSFAAWLRFWGGFGYVFATLGAHIEAKGSAHRRERPTEAAWR